MFGELPPFTEARDAKFSWGDLEGCKLRCAVHSVYADAVHWQCDNFQVPSGRADKDFVLQLTRLFHAYAEDSTLESVALIATMLLRIVLLQKPHA